MAHDDSKNVAATMQNSDQDLDMMKDGPEEEEGGDDSEAPADDEADQSEAQ